MNRFFNTVNRFAQQSDMIPIVDDANLQSIMLVCQNGVDSAVVTALTILARIDADNKLYGKEEQLDVTFVADQTEVYFGIVETRNATFRLFWHQHLKSCWVRAHF